MSTFKRSVQRLVRWWEAGQQIGKRRDQTPLQSGQWLRSFVAFEPFRVSGRLHSFSVFTSNNFETATWRALTIALLADVHAHYFRQQCFRERANFRMLSNS